MPQPRTTRTIRAAALVGGGLAAGVIAAGAIAASAQTTTSGTAVTAATSSADGSSSSSDSHQNRPSNGETAVTGSTATKLKAAALAKFPGSTVDQITTENDGSTAAAAYEVHLTKSDGTRVKALFDKNFGYLSSETEEGHGGHGDHGGHGGGNGETAVTGSKATTLKNAALAKVPGATVDEVTTDSGDAAYEVHLTKSDGTEVTVKFDKNLAYVSTESGRGK